MPKPLITPEQIRQALDYNPKTGVFKWKYRLATDFPSNSARLGWNARCAGKVAGHLDIATGYRRIMVLGRQYYAIQLVFILMTGEKPLGRTAVRDGNRDNLAWVNVTTKKQLKIEAEKRGAPETKGIDGGAPSSPGVVFDAATGRWAASLQVEFVNLSLGEFCTQEEAVKARQEKIKEHATAA
jgi:hypothetical protein